MHFIKKCIQNKTDCGIALWTSCKQQGVFAWSDHLCLHRAALPCLHTHKLKRQASLQRAERRGQCLPSRASSVGEESDSHTGAWAYHMLKHRWIQPPRSPIHSGNVHSKASWRRQEIYTESSGPKEGCAHPAQAPASAARWVEMSAAPLLFDVASPSSLDLAPWLAQLA